VTTCSQPNQGEINEDVLNWSVFMLTCFRLRGPDEPWGDYGSILFHGMSCYSDREDGLIQLERTGPFIPPISFPASDIIITAAFRQQLESAGLTGLCLRPVIKHLIVASEWHLWDRSAEDPAFYPNSGEPEDYILGHKHRADLADEMGPLWEVCPPVVARIERSDGIRLVVESIPSLDFFRAEGVGYNYVSARARGWLEDHAAEWVKFEDVLYCERG
jgi:hypothetical protein